MYHLPKWHMMSVYVWTSQASVFIIVSAWHLDPPALIFFYSAATKATPQKNSTARRRHRKKEKFQGLWSLIFYKPYSTLFQRDIFSPRSTPSFIRLKINKPALAFLYDYAVENKHTMIVNWGRHCVTVVPRVGCVSSARCNKIHDTNSKLQPDQRKMITTLQRKKQFMNLVLYL